MNDKFLCLCREDRCMWGSDGMPMNNWYSHIFWNDWMGSFPSSPFRCSKTIGQGLALCRSCPTPIWAAWSYRLTSHRIWWPPLIRCFHLLQTISLLPRTRVSHTRQTTFWFQNLYHLLINLLLNILINIFMSECKVVHFKYTQNPHLLVIYRFARTLITKQWIWHDPTGCDTILA